MSVTMICPNLNCGRTVVAPESARGRVVRCSHCKQVFMVPQRRAEPVPSPGPPQPAPPKNTP
jgi:DNA-directed RNA polymerase subunit RPC12/RpoP